MTPLRRKAMGESTSYGSWRVTVVTRSSDRSKEAISPTPVASAWATRPRKSVRDALDLHEGDEPVLARCEQRGGSLGHVGRVAGACRRP